jgi:hypothetical protein
LIDVCDADLAWRRQELTALRADVKQAQGRAADTAMRAAVTLSYAHWEGYVVTVSRALVDYVTGLRLTYDQLSDSYVAMSMAGRLNEAERSTRRIARHIDVVRVLRRPGDRATFPDGGSLIQAEGNLKSEKFRDLLSRLDLDDAPFELHYRWLDSELLRRRNHIAHGQSGHADGAFALEAIGTVGSLLDQFRTAVQNAVVLEAFKRAVPAAV